MAFNVDPPFLSQRDDSRSRRITIPVNLLDEVFAQKRVQKVVGCAFRHIQPGTDLHQRSRAALMYLPGNLTLIIGVLLPFMPHLLYSYSVMFE